MIFKVENLCFKYPDSNKGVLDNVSLTLEKGEILSILGPNGAGKSTLLNCMANLLVPESGSIKLEGNDISKMPVKEVASTISYVPQTHTPAFGYTVFDFVLMGSAPTIGLFQKPGEKERESTINALKQLGIEHLAEKPYTEISGGERQQATIARAIVQEPKAILFDEPTAHLDYGNQLRTLRLIKEMSEKGYAVVITTHNPDHAILLGGTAAILDRAGHLTIGDSKEIITEDCLKQVYKTELKLIYIEELKRVACISPNL
ncbi:MAG: ABC transporter ATP-binding protein [Oscillospiraceae bacterium]